MSGLVRRIDEWLEDHARGAGSSEVAAELMRLARDLLEHTEGVTRVANWDEDTPINPRVTSRLEAMVEQLGALLHGTDASLTRAEAINASFTSTLRELRCALEDADAHVRGIKTARIVGKILDKHEGKEN